MPGEAKAELKVRLLGPLQIERGAEKLPVPASRKARAILGYLVMARRPVTRQRLCDLFFDVPDDPRASLRWTLTKLRQLVDEPGIARIQASGDSLSFVPSGASVDVLEVLHSGAGAAPDMSGLFLEDAELPERHDFMLWLYGARDELRFAATSRLKDELAQESLDPERRLALGRQLLTLDLLDEDGCVASIEALVQLGRADAAREALKDAEHNFRRAGKTPPAAFRAALEARQPNPAPSVKSARSGQLIDMLPCVAILPFQNYGPDLVPDDLMDGFLESVIHMTSRFKFFRVLSLGSALELKGGLRDPHEVYARAGADYTVGGSIISRDGALKLRYRIVDARNGALLGSGELETATVNPSVLLEELPATLTPHIVHQCLELSRARASAVAEADRNEVEHYLHGLSCAYRAVHPDFPAAFRAFQAALDLRPDFAGPMAAAAHCKALLQLTLKEPVRSETAAQAHAAIALGGDDAFALSLGAWSLFQSVQDVEPALRASERAISLNPLARIVWTVNAWILAMIGEVERPLARWDKAEECSALGGSLDLIYSGRAMCLWMAGRFEEALAWAKRSLERTPSNPGALTAGLAAAVMLGDEATLRQMRSRLLQHYPEGADSLVIAGVPIVVVEKREAILAAVRRGLAAS